MQDRELCRQILGIEAPWFVERVELKLAEGGVHVYLEHGEMASWPCPECGASCQLYDHQGERQWRHLDTCQYQTILHARPPRSECGEHGVRVVKLTWAVPSSRFTALMERLVIDWLRAASQKAVGEQLGLSWDEIHGIMERAVERGLERRQAEPLPQLGIDEKAFRKGHKYFTLVNDLQRSRVLYVAEDRTQASVDGFWDTLTERLQVRLNEVSSETRERIMKVIVALISLFISCLGGAAFSLSKAAHKDVSSPIITAEFDMNNPPDSVRSVSTMSPTAPRDPADMLRGYEDDMRAVSARFVNELAVISKTFTERQITRDEAEHISKERYLVAMMQFELLSALHAQLEQELEREENSSGDWDSAPESGDVAPERALAVVRLPFSSFQMNLSLARQLELNSSQLRAIREIMSDERHKQEPLLKELQVSRTQLLVANQQAHIEDKERHMLARFQGAVVSKLIVANSRMQARIYEVLNADQKKKLEQLRRANAVTAGAE